MSRLQISARICVFYIAKFFFQFFFSQLFYTSIIQYFDDELKFRSSKICTKCVPRNTILLHISRFSWEALDSRSLITRNYRRFGIFIEMKLMSDWSKDLVGASSMCANWLPPCSAAIYQLSFRVCLPVSSSSYSSCATRRLFNSISLLAARLVFNYLRHLQRHLILWINDASCRPRSLSVCVLVFARACVSRLPFRMQQITTDPWWPMLRDAHTANRWNEL